MIDRDHPSLSAEDVFGLLKNLKVANQMLGDVDGTPATVAEHTPDKKLVLHRPLTTSSAPNVYVSHVAAVLGLIVVLLK